MPRRIDPSALHRELDRALARSPGASAADLCAALQVSQPTLSRLLAARKGDVLVVGRARRTRYALRRRAHGVPEPVPVFEVRPPGESPRHLLDLHLVEREGLFALSAGMATFSPDLPWFLQDIRPSGFLGRLVPRRFPTLGLPADVDLWSADDVLRFVCAYGWNLPGAFVLGEPAYAAFSLAAADPPDRVPLEARAERYAELAAEVLRWGPGGSSAGGEHPKFLATRGDGVAVLVKFSPPLTDPAAVRIADLLVAEHVAHETLRAAGQASARSGLLRAAGRLFLEIERFDRPSPGHRRGVISLRAVDAEYVGGPLDRWSTTTAALVRRGLLSGDEHRRVRWLEVFGDAIANTDMHPGNLSFWLDGTALADVAPAYDMLPMLYALRQRELVSVSFRPARPSPANADVAEEAWAAAAQFWAATAAHPDVSADFAAECARNAQIFP